MKPHPRIRTVTKWTLFALTVTSASLWIASGWFRMTWGFMSGWNAFIDRGLCNVIHSEHTYYRTSPVSLSSRHRPFALEWSYSSEVFATDTWYKVPLWPPVVLLSALSTALFVMSGQARRRARRGNCTNCNYNRTGLTATAPCPECGASAPALPAARS